MSRPNIVFICVDDQAAWSIGAYGNTEARTPNLDQLAGDGALLENCFCSTPVCSPARAAMMTGHYSCETNIPDFIPNPEHRAYKSSWDDIGIPARYRTFPSVLAEHGYTNGLIGKWHLGDWTQDKTRRFHPLRHGYHHFFGMTGGGVCPLNPEFEEEGQVKTFEGYCDEILTERALEFLRAQKSSSEKEPFLLSLHLRQPHSPWTPMPESQLDVYRDVDLSLPPCERPNLKVDELKRKMREYLSAVTGVDDLVGRVRSELGALELDKNTLLIFSADHGYNMGHHGISHKGNGIEEEYLPEDDEGAHCWRPNLYEESLRVPAILCWPGHIEAGQRIPHLISDVDWFPTILDLADCLAPVSGTGHGHSFAPLITGDRSIPWRENVYSEYDMCVYDRARLRGLRGQRWKLVADFHSPWRSALYDLESEAGEERNLLGDEGLSAEQRREVKTVLVKMSKQLRDIMRAHNDPITRNNNWTMLWTGLSN